MHQLNNPKIVFCNRLTFHLGIECLTAVCRMSYTWQGEEIDNMKGALLISADTPQSLSNPLFVGTLGSLVMGSVVMGQMQAIDPQKQSLPTKPSATEKSIFRDIARHAPTYTYQARVPHQRTCSLARPSTAYEVRRFKSLVNIPFTVTTPLILLIC